MINKHLVSWEDRQADHENPARGGSRNRYLFRTENGSEPSVEGRFRLYKKCDEIYDGEDKNGPSCPQKEKIDTQYYYLINWYEKYYVNS